MAQGIPKVDSGVSEKVYFLFFVFLMIHEPALPLADYRSCSCDVDLS